MKQGKGSVDCQLFNTGNVGKPGTVYRFTNTYSKGKQMMPGLDESSSWS